MKKTALSASLAALLSLAAIGNACAEWKELGSNEVMVVYVDLATIQDVGENAQIMSMLDFKKPGVNPTNKKAVNSIVGINEYNCPTVSYRPITFKEFSGKKGTGAVVSESNTPDSKFEQIVNESWPAGVFNVVCVKK
jgi:hypothetical protein